MNIDFSPGVIFAGLIFGPFGVYFLKIGKGDGNLMLLFIGIGLILVPYVIGGWLLWLIGGALLWLGFTNR